MGIRGEISGIADAPSDPLARAKRTDGEFSL